MKKSIFILLLPLIVSNAVQAASISYEKVSACLSEKADKCLIEVSRYDSQMLASIERHGSKNDSSEFSLLAKYYDYARQNQAANIVNFCTKVESVCYADSVSMDPKLEIWKRGYFGDVCGG